MKSYIHFLILIISTLLLHSCREVIEVDTPSAVTKLVIEADIVLTKGKDNSHQIIKLTETGDINAKKPTPATGAEVRITTKDDTDIIFEEKEPGIYSTKRFVAQLNEEYKLNIKYNNEVYQSSNSFVSVPAIKEISQTTDLGYSETTEVVWTWDDPAEANYYYFECAYKTETDTLKESWSWDDSYESGGELYDYFESEDFKKGVEVSISISGISKQYLTFIQLLYHQENAGAGPFSAPPVNVKGNILNITKPENYPYGFFSMREMDVRTYIVQ